MLRHYFHIEYKFTNTLAIKNNDFPNVDELSGKIFYNDHKNDICIEAGKIELHLYNFSFLDYGFNLCDAFDRSFETAKLGNAIFDSKTKKIKTNVENLIGATNNLNILVIQNLILFNEFRGIGYGAEIINGIEFFFNGKCGIIALQSFPKQHDIELKDTQDFQTFKLENLDDNIVTAQKSLNRFYEKCGFIKILNEDDCYIKNIAPI